MKMTEADLEARLAAVLPKLFPTLSPVRLRHQLSFSVKLGHKRYSVNGAHGAVRGRLDVLLLLDERPLVVLELKAPGVPLTVEDKRQGLSYARLHEPPVPLLVLTNGTQVELYTAWDGKPWSGTTEDAAKVEALLGQAARAAASDIDDAVQQLLGARQGLWRQVLRHHTQHALEELEGPVHALMRPLATDFSVPRTNVVRALAKSTRAHPLTILTGPPMSGKTNILWQLCKDAETHRVVPFYLDASAGTTAGPLDQLATLVTSEFFSATTRDQALQWLLHGARPPKDGRLVIIVDGASGTEGEQILKDLSLLERVARDRFSLLLCVDEAVWQRLSRRAGRAEPTPLARRAKVLKVEPLDGREFLKATRLARALGVGFLSGAVMNAEYREPRVLRLLVGTAHKARDKGAPDGLVNMLPAVREPYILEQAWSGFARAAELADDYRAIAREFARQRESPEGKPGVLAQLVSLFVHGQGALLAEEAEVHLGTVRVERLRREGHLGQVQGPDERLYLLPRMPELLAAAGARELGAAVASQLDEEQNEAAYCTLLRSEVFPMGDCVGALAVSLAERQHPGAISILINFLLDDEPRQEAAPAVGSKFLMVLGGRVQEVAVTEEMREDGTLKANLHPWLILAQFACHSMQLGEWEPDILAGILGRVASFPEVQRRPDDRYALGSVRPLRVHTVKGLGSFPCHRFGIVEPITQALHEAFFAAPDGIKSLVERLPAEKSLYVLTSRLDAAAHAAAEAADPTIKALAEQVLAATRERLGH